MLFACRALGLGLILRLVLLFSSQHWTLFVASQDGEEVIKRDPEIVFEKFDLQKVLCNIGDEALSRMKTFKFESLAFLQTQAGLSSEEDTLTCCVYHKLECANKAVERATTGVDARGNVNGGAFVPFSFSSQSNPGVLGRSDAQAPLPPPQAGLFGRGVGSSVNFGSIVTQPSSSENRNNINRLLANAFTDESSGGGGGVSSLSGSSGTKRPGSNLNDRRNN